jgi:hypothetical protein
MAGPEANDGKRLLKHIEPKLVSVHGAACAIISLDAGEV